MNPTSQHTALAAAEDVLTSLCARYGYEDDGFTPKDWSEWQEARRVKALCAAALSAPPAGEVAELIGRARDWPQRPTSFDQHCHLVQNLAAALERLSRPAPVVGKRQGIYVASRASLPARGEMWRALRVQGVPIISTWIDEDGPKASRDLSGLWRRINAEVTSARLLVLYVEPGDFPLKGALIEVGMALAANVPIVIVAPGVVIEERNCRPLGSWIKHPLVSFAGTVAAALSTPGDAQAGEAGVRQSCPRCKGSGVAFDGPHGSDAVFCPHPPAQPDRGMREGRDPFAIEHYDDGSSVHLSRYNGGTHPDGAWSGLSLFFRDKDGGELVRDYVATGPAHPWDDVAASEACIACGEPLKPDDLVLHDVGGGFIHAACCGPERASYVDLETGEPIGPGELIPRPFRYGDDAPADSLGNPTGEAG